MFNLIKQYKKLSHSVLNLIAAEFFIQLINSAFLAIQLIFMQKQGYSDHESAGFISMRFLGVLLFAIPLGYYIRGRKIRKLFFVSVIGVPLNAWLIVYSTLSHQEWLLYLSHFLWGVSFTFMQTPVIPYILRNTKQEDQTEGISLSYSTYSFGGIMSGLLIYILNAFYPDFFNEQRLLELIVLLGCIGVVFILRMGRDERIYDDVSNYSQGGKSYDWGLITKALIPTTIIAAGAGLTIPFIGIFFYNVHHLGTDAFAMLSAVGAVFVAIAAVAVPSIKKAIGYKVAVPLTQSIAVMALISLATTQFYAQLHIAVYIAIFCFLLRQPLMNMAGPMTTEIVMNYVGKKNQEMVSALTSAIWSGSWFLSSRIFKLLRENGVPYVNVFLITAGLYGIGVIWYYFLIMDYHQKDKIYKS